MTDVYVCPRIPPKLRIPLVDAIAKSTDMAHLSAVLAGVDAVFAFEVKTRTISRSSVAVFHIIDFDAMCAAYAFANGVPVVVIVEQNQDHTDAIAVEAWIVVGGYGASPALVVEAVVDACHAAVQGAPRRYEVTAEGISYDS